MTQTKPFGLILAGGRSTRMGSDKSLIDYHGKPQREYLFELLSGICEAVFTSCKQEDDVPQELHPLHDTYDYPGPINGILSAFARHPESSWLVVAVDMPFVDRAALELLIGSRDKTKFATCFRNTAGEHFPEPLLTLWEPAAYPQLLRYAKDGNISPRYFLQQTDIKLVPVPDPKILLNINSPHDRSFL